MAGDKARAESLAQDLGKRFPLHNQMQSLWVPAIQAQLSLDKKNPTAALTALYGDVGVGVFPEGEKIFVGGERPDAGGIGIRALRGSCLQGGLAS